MDIPKSSIGNYATCIAIINRITDSRKPIAQRATNRQGLAFVTLRSLLVNSKNQQAKLLP